ncbi:MAG: hypothetical protein EXR72_16250 [Myxococcales bacterium]|nr:hypothetical protein [Myxococcales bacterium]
MVGQSGSAEADRWFGEDAQVALWTFTPVEVVSALRRLVREGALEEGTVAVAEERLDELVRTCHVVIDVEAVKAGARRLLRLHPLRAADALQLGAALAWSAGDAPSGVLHTFDGRLGLAARREGFHVLPAPR